MEKSEAIEILKCLRAELIEGMEGLQDPLLDVMNQRLEAVTFAIKELEGSDG